MRATKENYGYNSPKVLLILIPIILAISFFVKSNYLISLATMVGIYSIVTFGLTLLMGYAGQISLGQAAFFGIGAYTSGILTAHHGVDPWIAMILGMVLSGLIAYMVGIPTMKLKEHFLALATMGFNVIVYVILHAQMNVTGGASGLGGIPKLSFFGFWLSSEPHYLLLVWSVVLLVALISFNIVNSHVGRILQGIHDSEIATLSVGVNIATYKIQIFVISAVFASLAGSLYAHYLNFIAPPTFFVTASIQFLIMVAVGGARPIWGAIVGALVITLLGDYLKNLIGKYVHAGGQVEFIIYGFLLIVVMIFFKKGIASILNSAWPKRKSVSKGEIQV